jgi:hypothetical protein
MNTAHTHSEACIPDAAACWDVFRDTPLAAINAATFARKRNLTSHDREDIEGDFVLEVCKAVRRFDPLRSSPKHYITHVLEKAYLRACRTHGTAKRRPKCVGLDDATNVAFKQSGSPVAQNACPQSVRRLVRDLPPDLRDLAFEMQFNSLRQIARERGVCHCTVLRQRDRLRRVVAMAQSENKSF